MIFPERSIMLHLSFLIILHHLYPMMPWAKLEIDPMILSKKSKLWKVCRQTRDKQLTNFKLKLSCESFSSAELIKTYRLVSVCLTSFFIWNIHKLFTCIKYIPCTNVYRRKDGQGDFSIPSLNFVYGGMMKLSSR